MENKYELYNLNIDPGELNNLVKKEREKFKALKRELRIRIGQIPSKVNIEEQIINEETKKQLRSLGYTE